MSLHRCAVLVGLSLLGCKKEQPTAAQANQAAATPPAGSATAPAGSATAPAGSATAPAGSATAPAGSGSDNSGAGGATRTVGPFTEVHIGSSLEADIDIGPQAPLQITGEPKIVAAVITEVKGNVLDIRLPNGHWDMEQRLKVHVTTPNLTAVQAETSSTVVGNGITEDTISVKAETSADVTLHGTCRVLDAKAETSAKLDASDLQCETVTVKTQTAANAQINATTSVTGSAETASHVHVTGTAKKDIKTSTAASVD